MTIACKRFKQIACVTLVVLFLIIGFSGCNIFGGSKKVVGGEFERTVLIEKGTATVCGACPEAAAEVSELVSTHPDETIHINVHCWGSAFETEELNARIDDHGNRYIPAVFIDGIKTEHDQVSMEAAYDEHHTAGSPVMIELSARLEEGNAYFDITIIGSSVATEALEATLRIALCQDSVDYSDERWDGLHNVARRLPEATDDDQFTLDASDTLTFERQVPYDTNWTRPLTAVVWVEDKNLVVYQATSDKLE